MSNEFLNFEWSLVEYDVLLYLIFFFVVQIVVIEQACTSMKSRSENVLEYL